MTEELAEVVAEEDAAAETLPAVRDEVAPATLFGTDDPLAVIEKATAIANALAQVIEQKKLYTVMGRDKDGNERRHVKVEGWTLLGSMLGVFPETEWTRETKDSNGSLAYEARVVARTRDGSVVGAREAMCSKSEPNWKSRDDYAIKSMAQTRATSGALAQPLRFIVVLAGFEGTPEAEMPRGEAREEVRVNAPQPSVPRTWQDIISRLQAMLGDDEAMEWLGQAKELKEMGVIDTKDGPQLVQRLGGVCVDLTETGYDLQFTPGARKIVSDIFAARLDGNMLDGPAWALEAIEAEQGRPSKEQVLAEDPETASDPVNEDEIDAAWEASGKEKP